MMLVFLFITLYALAADGQDTDVCVRPGEPLGRQCINIRRCPPLLRMLNEVKVNPDVGNYLRSAQCGFEENDPKVCCPNNATTPAIPEEMENPKKYYGDTNSTTIEFAARDDAHISDVCVRPGEPYGRHCINIRRCPPLLQMLNEVKVNPDVSNYIISAYCGLEGKDPKVCCPNDGMTPTLPEEMEYTEEYYDDINSTTTEIAAKNDAKIADVCVRPGEPYGRHCINIRRCPPLLQMLNEVKVNPDVSNYIISAYCGLEGKDPKVCCPNDGMTPTLPEEMEYTEEYYDDINSTTTEIAAKNDAKIADVCVRPGEPYGLHCINIRRCPPLLQMLNEVKVNPDVGNYLRSAQCGFEGKDPKVCCPNDGVTPTPPEENENPEKLYNVTNPTLIEIAARDDAKLADVCVSTGESYGHRCVNIYSCPHLLQVLKEVKTNPDHHNYLRSKICGHEENIPKVCCSIDGMASTPPKVKEYPEGYCGVNDHTMARIVGGYDAKLGDLPWMALLGYTGRDEVETGRPEWRCGGSLVSAYHVLTAAHCVDRRLYLVRLGELDVASETEGAFPIDYRIALKVVHPGYDPLARVSDIAVLKLKTKVKFNDLILPICLPLSSELRSYDFAKYMPYVAGWGSLKYAGDTATKLQMVQVPATTTEECQFAYRSYSSNVVDERVVCAGHEFGDSCDGDSGGPLMQPMPDPVTGRILWYAIGILSYGVKCAEPEYPTVYMRVTAYIPWIQKQLTIDK